MQRCGWEEKDGVIFFKDESETEFDSWEEAIRACIEIASGV
jgi:hypothetical protein